MSSRREEHEAYLERILSNSLTSANPSKEAFERAKKESPTYFNNLKMALMNKYKDWDLMDIEGSKVIENIYGKTLKITRRQAIDFSLEDKKESIKNELLSNFKLMPGVGLETEMKLKREGYDNLYDLLEHDRYSYKAEKLIKKIEKNCFIKEFKLLKQLTKYPGLKNSTLKSLNSLDPFNLKFMDIETLGLSSAPIILLGIAEIKGKYIESNQYLLRDKEEEPALIEAYLSHIDEASVHVTYNGASFDIPFIKNRARLYRMDCNLDQTHFDLMYPARNLWKDVLPNCKLTTIEEEIFNIKREDDVPGAFIPDYYESYLATKNIGPLIPIIEHNRMDIVSLADFLMKIYEESF
ncbi:ribonuclease H-like domain-containing protein [Methanobrevibacter sp.]|uniref:ribonuclease H-like domain-containing protein n=1 Tax=Methanobrevibacter sp. TaxID=66852 RepID=UPI00388E338F